MNPAPADRARNSSIATGGLPDLRRLLRATALALVTGSAAAQDCTPRLTLSFDTTAGVQAIYMAPCAPYAPVTVALGALVFGEQTGRAGDLRLNLPALPDGGILTVTLDGTVTRAPLPAPAGPVPDIAAVSWPDGPPPDLPGVRVAESGQGATPRRLGFPGETPVVDLLPAVPDHIDLVVTPTSCGRSYTAQIINGDSIRALRVTLPDCDGLDGALRIPLAP